MITRTLACWLLCVLLLAALAVPAAAETVTCDVCGAKITGSYSIYRGHGQTLNICSTCVNQRPHCALCGVPMLLGQMTRLGDQNVCPRCVGKAKLCDACGELIRGKFWTTERRGVTNTFCDRCYQSRPKCAVCKRPIPNSILENNIPLVQGQRICHDCYVHADRCQTCSDPIIGKAYVYEGLKGKYCEKCHLGAHCSSCGVPIGDGGWELPDGRLSCDACNADAIHKVEEAERILKEVERTLARELDMRVRTPYEFKLVKRENPDLQIFSPVKNNELGLFVVKNGDFHIYILGGLPRGLFYETAAHELAHAWQAENSARNQTQLIREGFAQWVASKILIHYKFPNTLAALNRRDDVYGRGYRHFLNLETRHGRDKLFEIARMEDIQSTASPRTSLTAEE